MRIPMPHAAAVLVGLAAPMPAQQASYAFFGSGCAPTGAYYYAPTLTVHGLPRVGQSFTVIYSGPNSCNPPLYCAQPVLLTGLSNTSWGGVALPFRIPNSYGSPLVYGCTLRVSPDVLLFMSPGNGSGSAFWQDRVTFPIPNSQSLLGVAFYQQWLTLVSFTFGGGTQAHSMYSTRGGHGLIGT